jgi:hypothetical protein
MRVLFAWIVWLATPKALIVNGIPAPNGIARLIDLHFLIPPNVYAEARMILGAVLVLYVLRIAVWLALPVALFINVAAGGIMNSQGAIQHAYQIVSLVLFAQTAAHFYGLWRRRSGEARDLLESRAIWWSQQTIVAVYLLAAIAKLIVTRGLWIYEARWIGVSIGRAAYQSFYDRLDPVELQRQLAIADFAATHGWLVALIAGAGLLLELASPVMLINRAWAAIIGAAMICFHLGLDYSMRLTFIYNQWLLMVFMINVPYWVVTCIRRFVRRRGDVPT